MRSCNNTCLCPLFSYCFLASFHQVLLPDFGKTCFFILYSTCNTVLCLRLSIYCEKILPEAVGNPIEPTRCSLTTCSCSFSAISLLYPRASFVVFHILHNKIALFEFAMSVLYKLLRNHHSGSLISSLQTLNINTVGLTESTRKVSTLNSILA